MLWMGEKRKNYILIIPLFRILSTSMKNIFYLFSIISKNAIVFLLRLFYNSGNF